MTNNYVFQRLLAVFSIGGWPDAISKSKIKSWRTHDQSSRHHTPMPDDALVSFLNGLQCLSKEGNMVVYYP